MMNIIEAIKTRRSTRSFTGETLTAPQRDALKQCIASCRSPFGGDYGIYLREFDSEGPERPGTYGFISGCRSYLLLTYDASDEASVLSAGYCTERVVLECTRLGLGSCWLGGTFRSGDFKKALGTDIPQNQELHIVVAIGNGRSRRSLIDNVAGFIVGSSKRKPMADLFSDAAITAFGRSLEMMRLAPSARNLQPWRATVEGDNIHFFRTAGSDYTLLDCGIGLCHFHLAELAEGHNGSFFKASATGAGGWQYVISYHR